MADNYRPAKGDEVRCEECKNFRISAWSFRAHCARTGALISPQEGTCDRAKRKTQ